MSVPLLNLPRPRQALGANPPGGGHEDAAQIQMNSADIAGSLQVFQRPLQFPLGEAKIRANIVHHGLPAT